jgi:hypothetical protein
VDFTVLLPPGWVRIPLDGRENARAVVLADAKASEAPGPQRQAARQQLRRLLHQALTRARQAAGTDVLISLAELDEIPIPASCLVSYVEHDRPVPLDRLAARLAEGRGDVRTAEVGGLPAVRHRYQEDLMTRVDYHLRVPGRAGLMTLAFATPLEPLAGPLTLLFDAIAGSLRWRP